MSSPRHSVSDTTTVPGDLTDLRAFCTVADLGSITAAAESMRETKGSVSRRISRLERHLGVALLRRSTRAVRVTEDGAAFRARVGQALEMLDEATGELLASGTAPHGLLRVTAPSDLGNLFAPLIAGFAESYPAVRVDAILTQTELDFDAHQLDVAIRASARLRDSSLIAHKLLDLTMGFYASPSYLKAHRAPRTPTDLASHRIVVMRYRATEASFSLRAVGSSGPAEVVSLRGAITANDHQFVREAAIAGAGIAPLPWIMTERDVAEGRLVRVLDRYEPVTEGGLYLLHASSAFLPAKVRVFRDYVRTQMAAQCEARRAVRRREAR